MRVITTFRLHYLFFAALLFVTACKKDAAEVISGFSFKADTANFLKIDFTNASNNYNSVQWDFGDGSAKSTEVNPSHTYAAAGPYTVTLTATGDGGTDVSSQVVTIVDPNAELTKLTGSTSKTWKLLRVPGTNAWPLEVGPIAKDQIWWAQGRDNDEIAKRPCIMNDEFIFSRDGKYEYKTNGDFWAEGGVFEPANLCQEATAANLKGPGGVDLSAFGDGIHSFVLTTGTNPTVEVVGLGAFVGLPKIGTDFEVKVPQNSVKLDVIRLTDGAVDTLILESKYKWATTDTEDKAYWRITLVHYDNAADEPAIPSPKAEPNFSFATDGLTATFTNESKYSTSYSWDFGDGSTSTQVSPTHTYAAGGAYSVKLTATNNVGSQTTTKEVTVSDGNMTLANLVGSAWKVRNDANSIFVGPALGDASWWQVPANFLNGGATGTDDWSCITNDEFIFGNDGSYTYKTNGDARNDGYMGSPNGCWSDAQVAASGNGAAFGSGIHSFTFTPATSTTRPIITLNNGSTGAAFLGFYKGYYGGENTDGSKAPNGGASSNRYEVMSYIKNSTQEILIVSVDISDAKDGSKAWSMVLTR